LPRVLKRAPRGGTILPMTRERSIAPATLTQLTTRGVDVEIAALADRQHGVVPLAQLVALGLGPSAVRERVRAGRLHRIHRGVYSVGYSSLTAEGRWMAAVLACGEGAVLSHRSAAILWGLREGGGPRVEVTSRRRVGRTRAGILVHWRAGLDASDLTARDGIPCTSVARTLLDLAEALAPDGVERACARAEVLRLFDRRALDELLARSVGRRGTRRLREVLGRLDPRSALTRSEIERLFLGLCRDFGLRTPLVNDWVELDGSGFQPDFLWPDERLIVETDGGAVHQTRRAFEDDRRRDQLLAVAGYRTLRFTWRQVTYEPARVALTVGAVLAERSVTPTSP
jgi:hypothetical protein